MKRKAPRDRLLLRTTADMSRTADGTVNDMMSC